MRNLTDLYHKDPRLRDNHKQADLTEHWHFLSILSVETERNLRQTIQKERPPKNNSKRCKELLVGKISTTKKKLLASKEAISSVTAITAYTLSRFPSVSNWHGPPTEGKVRFFIELAKVLPQRSILMEGPRLSVTTLATICTAVYTAIPNIFPCKLQR